MENIGRPKHKCNPIPSPTSKLAMHRDSHVIAKPAVRIIHIFAPEIIKTDVANFRELVQRLTGKPGDLETGSRRNTKTVGNSPCCKKLMTTQTTKKKKIITTSDESNRQKMQLQDYGLSMEDEQSEIWSGGESSSNHLLDGFADFNSFIHNLSHNVSLTTSQIDVFGDLHFA
ncbi:VQ motif-containing protein 25-like [Mercurialis annua]|uniref:VQ motif-containing protein 25-like n=1 Tax=Mercurialis annua TaxID=3986 RepID=UPI00215EEF8F|nr:VQ motif-containing protein 25-like [Mercurialis annua]